MLNSLQICLVVAALVFNCGHGYTQEEYAMKKDRVFKTFQYLFQLAGLFN